MSDDLKKEKVKKTLLSIEHSAYNLIDDGTQHEPMHLVMELTVMAYELDLLTGFTSKYDGDNQQSLPHDNVVNFKPKDIE
jgi:hypothetical protein